MAGPATERGVGGATDSLHILDVATGFRFCSPVDSKDSLDTLEAVVHFLGDDRARRAYGDNWDAYRHACRHLGIAKEDSQPGLIIQEDTKDIKIQPLSEKIACTSLMILSS